MNIIYTVSAVILGNIKITFLSNTQFLYSLSHACDVTAQPSNQ